MLKSFKGRGSAFLEVQPQNGLQVRVLHVKGSPYEMGFQHGRLLKDLIEKNVAEFIDNTPSALAPRIKSFQQNLPPKLMGYIPNRFQEEMQGVADGSGVPLQKIIALNTFPELIHCSGITVSDAATKQGDLYHVRVLDYAVGKSLQNTAVLMVVQPRKWACLCQRLLCRFYRLCHRNERSADRDGRDRWLGIWPMEWDADVPFSSATF